MKTSRDLRKTLDYIHRYALRLRWSDNPFDNHNINAIIHLSAPTKDVKETGKVKSIRHAR